MRLLLLWCLLGLGVMARADDGSPLASPNQPATVVEEEDDNDLLDTLDEDARINVARMLGDILEFNDDDDEAHDLEEGIQREPREEESTLEQKAKVEPEDQVRFNKFIDTFFRRLNSDVRSSSDPLDVPLVSKKTKKGGAKKGGSKKKDKNKETKKAGNKKKTKKNKKKVTNKKSKNKKTKKTGRHPKNLDLETGEGVGAVEDTQSEEEGHHIVTREAEEVEEIEEEEDGEEQLGLARQDRSLSLEAVEDKEGNESEAAVGRRKGKPKSGKNKKDKNKKDKNKGGKRKRENKKKKGKSKTKRSANKKKDDKKKGKSSSGKKSSGPKTSRASVSGIASLVRDGDVSVVERKEGKELRTDFTLGPVNLKVNRKFGSGKNAVVRTATASSPELTGKMYLYVAANGRARITKFNINRPSVVTTSGNLNKDLKRSGNNNFMESSINRITPTAAKKLKKAARAVLQATESKN